MWEAWIKTSSAELHQLIISCQEIAGKGLDVAIASAGLPGAVSSVLSDKVLAFLNRASKTELEPLAFGVGISWCKTLKAHEPCAIT